jgi:hypothetical protein
MIGNRPITVLRATESGERDAEGRRVAGQFATVAVVKGNLYDRAITYTNTDGQLITVFDGKALLPPSTDVRPQDLLEADGVRYRVTTVTLRYSPFGATHHRSVQCVREDRGDE